MASFKNSFVLGQGVANVGIESYDRERKWSELLTHGEEERAAKKAALELEAGRHIEERGDKAKSDYEKTIADAAKAKEDESQSVLRKSQAALYDAEAESIKSGKGRYNSPPRTGAAAQIPPEVRVAMANRDNARKQISALAAGGILTPPPEMQAKLDASEGALSRVARANKFDLGEDAAASADFNKSLDAIRKKAQAE